MLRGGSPIGFSGSGISLIFKLGIRDFNAKSGRDSRFTVCAGGGLPKITLGITRSFGSGFSTELKIRIGYPLRIDSLLSPGLHYNPPSLAVFESFILTHIFLGHFPILPPYKNTELADAAVIQLDFSPLAMLY